MSTIIIGKIWYWSVRFDMHACQNAYCNTEFGIDNIVVYALHKEPTVTAVSFETLCSCSVIYSIEIIKPFKYQVSQSAECKICQKFLIDAANFFLEVARTSTIKL